MKKILFTFNLLLLSLFISFNVNSQTVNIKIIETSDIHGHIFPYDFVNDTALHASQAQVSEYVKQERAKKNQEVVLLDNGDILQGQPLVYYYNFEKIDTTHICSRVMNYMKYDAATVGNHDIEPGHQVYDKIKRELNFPWMAANAVDNKTNKPYFQPYTIISRRGVKIAVLGMITPGIPYWLPENIWEGITFNDMIESSKKWVKIINEKEHPDILIGLFHSGVDYTYGNETADTYRNENASKLVAQRVSGFDVIFAGHDHHKYNMKIRNQNGEDVILMDPARHADYVSVANITLKYDSLTNEYDKTVEGELVDIKNYKPDAEFIEKFKSDYNEVKNYVSKPIGVFTKTISTRDALFGNSSFVDLIQNIQLGLTKADISFAAPLLFDAKINKGEVYVRDMFKLYKFENLLYTMELSGTEVKNYLEFSYDNWFNQMKDENDNLLKFRTDSTGEITNRLANSFYNFSSAAGIKYTVDVLKPAGEKINIISMSDGSAFDLNKKYKIAINSYRGNGGGGHLITGAKISEKELPTRIITSTQKDLRYFLMKWIEKNKIITPKKLNNWTVFPQEWWEKGKAKDYEILYK
ncbi:MAG: bifunctional metallophosphatase/5'-nucleotidase [Bacteroidetes bacterium]|nr:MAG: bifunctional metallophosphatase/5'-nucleotidase [Bacteroidota bacterium]